MFEPGEGFLRLDKGAGRLIKLLLVGVVSEALLGGVKSVFRFPLVFLAVRASDGVGKPIGDKAKTLYLEDVLTAALAYSAFGLLAYYIDVMLAGYTGKHSGAAIPAVILALADRMWPTQGLSNKRGRHK